MFCSVGAFPSMGACLVGGLKNSASAVRVHLPSHHTLVLCFRYLLHVLRSKAKILHFPSTPRSLDRMSFPPPLAGPFNSPGPSPGGSFRFPTNFPSSSQPANVFSSVELAGIGQPYSNLPRPQRLEFVHQSNYQMYTTPNSIAQIPWSSPAHLTRPEESVEEETSDTTVTEFDEHVDEQMDSSQTDERALAFEFTIEARLHLTKLHRGEGVRRLSDLKIVASSLQEVRTQIWMSFSSELRLGITEDANGKPMSGPVPKITLLTQGSQMRHS